MINSTTISFKYFNGTLGFNFRTFDCKENSAESKRKSNKLKKQSFGDFRISAKIDGFIKTGMKVFCRVYSLLKQKLIVSTSQN